MTRDEQRELMARALVEELTSEEAELLLQECRRKPELLEELSRLVISERLLAYLHLYPDEGAFEQEIQQRLRQADAPRGKIIWAVPWRQAYWRQAAAIAALLVLLGSLAVALWPRKDLEASVLVLRTEALVVTPGQPVLKSGRELTARRLQLDSGLLELQFEGGARVIVEGPADFEVGGTSRCILHRGKVVARVPKSAHGFAVDGPRGRLVDLGTEFAVNVNPSGDTEVHVLEGRVEATPKGQQKPVELAANQALRLTSDATQSLPLDATGFVTDMPPDTRGPIGYVHWAFDEGQGEVSRNSGQGLASEKAWAHLLSFEDRGPGPQWVPGQFGSGLALNGEGDYVECEFGGIGGGQARTVAFWVKVPQDLRLDQSDAIINWGTDAREGAVWRVSVNNNTDSQVWGGPLGRLRLGVNGGFVVGTTDLRDDRWHHCAVVMYGGARPNVGSHVLIYIDGQLEPAARKKVFEISTDIQHATAHNIWIGRNLSYRTAGQKVPGGSPFFRGCVDEVFVFNAALTQEQIVSLMKYNRLEASLPVAAGSTVRGKSHDHT
jgi:hypothetical protein